MSTFDTDGQDEGNGNEYQPDTDLRRKAFSNSMTDHLSVEHKCPYCKKPQGKYQDFEGVIICSDCKQQYWLQSETAILYTTYKRAE